MECGNYRLASACDEYIYDMGFGEGAFFLVSYFVRHREDWLYENRRQGDG